MLALAFLRVDPTELRHHFTQPGLIAAATVWVMLVVPAVLGTLFLTVGLDRQHAGAVLHAGAADVGARTDVVAGTGRADGARRGAHAGKPGRVHRDHAADREPVQLTSFSAARWPRLTPSASSCLLIIAGSALAAAVIRRIAGRAWVEAQRERIDGLSVLAMFMFAVARHGRRGRPFPSPTRCWCIKLTALAFALALGLIAITALVFLRAGRARALAIGLIAGNRNIGLMLAATGFLVPDVAWLYFALAQFPIYLLPHLLKPLARRLAANR